MTESLTIAETLNKAADLIEERGWQTGSYRSSALCLETALSSALGKFADQNSWNVANTCAAGLAMREYLGLGQWPHGSKGSLWCWNDAPERTAEQVIEALRACAVIAESRETSAVASTHTAGLPGAEVGA